MIFECFPAIALKWLNAGMNARVSNQSTELRKRFRANVTLIRFLASMRAKMNCQMLRSQTRSVAGSTHVWSDEHVSSRVQSQSALSIERFITLSAFERLLASMRAKMKCQILRTQTRFIARSTHVWSDEHVSSRVSCQSALLSKRFITLSAFERLLARMRAKMIFFFIG